jgi:hypothetical protein
MNFLTIQLVTMKFKNYAEAVIRIRLAKMIRQLGYHIKQSLGLYKLVRLICINHVKTRRVINYCADRLHGLAGFICKHPNTYESHYWSGGKHKCSVCHKTLKILWLPEKYK